MGLYRRGLVIKIENFINPHSAIRNPQSQSNILSNFQLPTLEPHTFSKKSRFQPASPR
jgi:hypothetical protein